MLEQNLTEIKKRENEWRTQVLKKQLEMMGERKEKFETDSGIPVKFLYTPLDLAENDYLKSIGFPRAG